ncbi:unnamed protein product [Rotaria sordida]|uniref:Uncharacterized protein n=1 Tax=Rotaria sordida TaxID=392033 RepID=A0A815K2N7_9BILA|nr:unnamed protein product [Rotaria sordida]CAF1488585.1 unnamed protein product [Rotaria sordida]CAF1619897.1 unnamed protein product [Rotaria sordida]CAF4115856.1 unnamed protein product [Rotaria sordida]
MSKLRTLTVTDSYQHLELIDQISSITNLTIPNCNFHPLQRILKTVTMLKYINCSNLLQHQMSSNNSIEFEEDYQGIHLKQLIILEFQGTFSDLQMFIKHIPNFKKIIISADYERKIIDAYH